jgi:hypothetical protein
MPDKTEQETNTVRLNITVNKELDSRFREAVAQTIGFKKGNLQVAIEEALDEWIKQHKKDRK